MRIAIISDIHGNKNALDAVLADIHLQSVDQIVCAGDFIDPLPESRDVYYQLKKLSIPLIRGNHEDYVIDSVTFEAASKYNTLQNWKPVKTTAQLFSVEEVKELQALPIKLELLGSQLLVCHASPESNIKGWLKGIDQEMEQQLQASSAEVIACGHWHVVREEQWQQKRLVMVGSVGVPLNGKPQAEYSIITKTNDWKVEGRTVPYDHIGTARKYVDSGFVKSAAPISFLLLDEFLTAQRRIAPFMSWKNEKAQQLDWDQAVELYLKNIGRWKAVTEFAQV